VCQHWWLPVRQWNSCAEVVAVEKMLESAMCSSVQIFKHNDLQVAALVSAYCYLIFLYFQRGMCLHSWLRHCTTSRKVAGSIPDDVIGIFHCQVPTDCTIVLGLTQPQKDTGIRNISCGYRQLVFRTDNLTSFTCQLSWNVEPSSSCPGLYRDSFTCLCLIIFPELLKPLTWAFWQSLF
jgi:hypothetical protein